MPRKSGFTSCQTDGCDNKHYAKGFCKPHYMIANRPKFNTASDTKTQDSFDYDDYWEFVKKELKIG